MDEKRSGAKGVIGGQLSHYDTFQECDRWHGASSSDPIDDEDYCALALFRGQLRSFLSFREGAAAEAGLTAQPHQALLAIRAAAERSLPVGELADQLDLRPHSATGLVDRLARLGLVERKDGDSDRGRIRVALTQDGLDKIETLSAAHRHELRRLRPRLIEMLGKI